MSICRHNQFNGMIFTNNHILIEFCTVLSFESFMCPQSWSTLYEYSLISRICSSLLVDGRLANQHHLRTSGDIANDHNLCQAFRLVLLDFAFWVNPDLSQSVGKMEAKKRSCCEPKGDATSWAALLVPYIFHNSIMIELFCAVTSSYGTTQISVRTTHLPSLREVIEW